MATQLTEAVGINKRIDDSEFENFNGQLVRRPVPKEEHLVVEVRSEDQSVRELFEKRMQHQA